MDNNFEMENILNVEDENGNLIGVEVLDIFTIPEYPDKQYIMYSKGETVDEENEKVYVSIIDDSGESAELLDIEDENEWNKVQEYINKVSSEGDINA